MKTGKMRIKKGDTVAVLSGKDKGKKGKVLQAFPADMQVLVEGINLKKTFVKARRVGKRGGNDKGKIMEKPFPMSVSTVALIDPKDGKPTRVRIEKKDGKISRVGVRSGEAI
jgi:large subunit ribosomal protein L24